MIWAPWGDRWVMKQMQSPGDPYEWTPWPVNWTAVFVGALTALAAALILGLIGTAIGAVTLQAGSAWDSVTRRDVVAAVVASFFAFAAGGWVAGKIAGARYAEPAMLHAAVSWLVALPLMVAMMGAGAGNAFGGWYGGLVSVAGRMAAGLPPPSPESVRAGAAAALTAVLLGLIGSVIGGWVASGEPMNFSHYRSRKTYYAPQRRILP